MRRDLIPEVRKLWKDVDADATLPALLAITFLAIWLFLLAVGFV